MITSRSFLLFVFLALLSGCGGGLCVAPGELSEAPFTECYYKLQVKEVDMYKYLVTAMVPGAPDMTYTFRVRDLDKLGNVITPGATYFFMRENNSPYLEHFPVEPKPPTTR
jgi:hypothetical protein